MLRTKIPTNTAGVYLYRGSKQIWIDEIGRELVIVLCCPRAEVCGIVVYPESYVRGELFDLLQSLQRKLVGELAISTVSIEAKVFGCSNGQTNALFAAQVWLSDQQLKISAMDTGRNVTRSLVIDTQSGKVGARFADADSVLGAGFIRSGTKARRTGARPSAHPKSLILVTDNRNFEFLATQSLDAAGSWTIKALSSKEFGKAPRRLRLPWLKAAYVVVVFEDVLESANLAKNIIALRKRAPDVRWLWALSAGTEVPLPLETIALPSADAPQTFGEQVAEALALDISETKSMGTVLPLNSRRTR